jgi:hypothetical protein
MEQLQQFDYQEVIWPDGENALSIGRIATQTAHLNEQVHVSIE